MVQLWQTSYTGMRLIDNNYFHERRDAMELAIFQSECVKQLEASKRQLLTGWFPECQRIFYAGNKRRLIPTMRDLVSLSVSYKPHSRCKDPPHPYSQVEGPHGASGASCYV